jgi:hypothetical protein
MVGRVGVQAETRVPMAASRDFGVWTGRVDTHATHERHCCPVDVDKIDECTALSLSVHSLCPLPVFCRKETQQPRVTDAVHPMHQRPCSPSLQLSSVSTKHTRRLCSTAVSQAERLLSPRSPQIVSFGFSSRTPASTLIPGCVPPCPVHWRSRPRYTSAPIPIRQSFMPASLHCRCCVLNSPLILVPR